MCIGFCSRKALAKVNYRKIRIIDTMSLGLALVSCVCQIPKQQAICRRQNTLRDNGSPQNVLGNRLPYLPGHMNHEPKAKDVPGSLMRRLTAALFRDAMDDVKCDMGSRGPTGHNTHCLSSNINDGQMFLDNSDVNVRQDADLSELQVYKYKKKCRIRCCGQDDQMKCKNAKMQKNAHAVNRTRGPSSLIAVKRLMATTDFTTKPRALRIYCDVI